MGNLIEETTTKRRVNLPLLGAVLTANLMAFATGNAYMFTSPVLPKLNGKVDTDDNPFGYAISPMEESLIASLINLGASVGPVIGGLCVNRIGRKRSLLILSLPMIVSFFITAFATSPVYYYVARFLLGLGVGCTYSLVPMYVAEISEDFNRGAMGCLLGAMICVGSLFGLGVGPYVSIMTYSLLSVIPLAAFVVFFSAFVPESPYYYVLVGKEEEARAALRKIRICEDHLVDKELVKIVAEVENSVKNSSNQNMCSLLNDATIKRAMSIGIGLMFFQQMSSIAIMVSYLQSIFEASASAIPAELSAIAAGVIQLIANLVTTQFVDSLGRKVLLASSLLLSVISHASLGAYFLLQDLDHDVSGIFWLPTASVMLFFVAYNVGIGPVGWTMTGELFPPNIKSVATAASTIFCLALAFVLSFIFPSVAAFFGMTVPFWFFTIGCAVGIVFVVLAVPETKGKSLQEIQTMLGQGSKT